MVIVNKSMNVCTMEKRKIVKFFCNCTISSLWILMQTSLNNYWVDVHLVGAESCSCMYVSLIIIVRLVRVLTRWKMLRFSTK